jgi:glycosyltransferase involved in cell wall biosynthesis
VSYDGVLEPLGESQVLQYLEGLARNYPILLMSFEKPSDWADASRRRAMMQRTAACGIRWIPLRYTKSPVLISTAYDILRGLLSSIYFALRYRVKFVHARSYVPSVIALSMKRLLGTGFIFDMRGFWPDERVNAGQWDAEGRVYRTAKWFERRFLKSADVIVSLTHAAAKEMRTRPYLKSDKLDIEVIPTCVNSGLFRPVDRPDDDKAQLASESKFVLGCVGSVTGWSRFDAVLDFFACLTKRRPEARLLVLNRGQHDQIHQLIGEKKIPAESIQVASVEFGEVSNMMALMDAGVFFYTPSFSELARSPTKMAEFLACGVPCVTNRGIGDSATILSASDIGVVLDDFGSEEFTRGAREILELARQEAVRDRCVKVAEECFSLQSGIESYCRIYARIVKNAER